MGMLLLTPIGLDARCWRVAGLELDGALAPEYPGHATGGDVLEGARLDELADSAAARLEGQPAADVLGVSMGGMVAMHLAVRHPDRVRSLVLACCGPATNGAVMRDRAEHFRTAPEPELVQETLDRWFSPQALADLGHPGVAYAREALAARGGHVLGAGWDALAEHDVRDALGGISLPVTVIGGSEDASTPPAAVEALGAAIPGSRVEMLAGGRHMLMLEDPSTFSQLVREHLERVHGGGRTEG